MGKILIFENPNLLCSWELTWTLQMSAVERALTRRGRLHQAVLKSAFEGGL